MSDAIIHHAHLGCGHIQNISKAEYQEYVAMLFCRTCQRAVEVERRCGRSG